MARRDLPPPAPTNDAAASEPASSGESLAAPSETAPPKRSLRWLALAVLVGWVAGLAALAALTANPVTLNRDQILHAHFIVTAKVVNRAGGIVEVSREWKHGAGAPAKSITLDNLGQTGVMNGKTYLIPVTRRPDGRLIVTETRLPQRRPLVYPDTEEATQGIEALLKEQAANNAAGNNAAP